MLDAGSHPSAKFTPAVELIGTTLVSVRRRAKYLLVELDDGRELVAHLGMTGGFALGPTPTDEAGPNPHLRAWWHLAAGAGRPAETLLFSDVRRFGRLRVVPFADYEAVPTLRNVGPEPFDPELDGRLFWERLGMSRRMLKTKLLSQRPIAGVGNIYADEALWLAQINPRTTRLGIDRATLLLDTIRQVLRQGIERGGTTLRDYRTVEGATGTNQTLLRAYGRAGSPCARCGRTLRSSVLDGRTTTSCPSCQRR